MIIADAGHAKSLMHEILESPSKISAEPQCQPFPRAPDSNRYRGRSDVQRGARIASIYIEIVRGGLRGRKAGTSMSNSADEQCRRSTRPLHPRGEIYVCKDHSTDPISTAPLYPRSNMYPRKFKHLRGQLHAAGPSQMQTIRQIRTATQLNDSTEKPNPARGQWMSSK